MVACNQILLTSQSAVEHTMLAALGIRFEVAPLDGNVWRVVLHTTDAGTLARLLPGTHQQGN